jgi:hypothetical protein
MAHDEVIDHYSALAHAAGAGRAVTGCGRHAFELRHPQVGPLELHYEKLLVPDARGQHLVMLGADPGSPSAEALTLLVSLQPGAAGPVQDAAAR